MRKAQTAHQLRGRAISAIFFASFGAVWLALSLHNWQMLSIGSASALAVGLVLLVGSALRLLRAAKLGSLKPAVARARRRINLLLGLAIVALYFGLSRLHLEAYFPSALTALVAVHKFALARALAFAPYQVTGAILMAWAVVSAWFFPVELLPNVAGFGTGLLLWLSAAITLTIAIGATRPLGNSLSC